jgi:methylated-DNA-[protein]-cysteine S-methyltransferase
MNVGYSRIATPLGAMLLAASDEGLCGAWFVGQKHAPALGAGWREDASRPVLRDAAAQLGEYFAGTRTHFALPLAPRGTPFQRAIWDAIAAVPFGATISYAALATHAGHPGAARAAGAATGRNPLSIVVPCHRIVGAGGALVGYAGGLERKRRLLAQERTAAARPPARRAA